MTMSHILFTLLGKLKSNSEPNSIVSLLQVVKLGACSVMPGMQYTMTHTCIPGQHMHVGYRTYECKRAVQLQRAYPANIELR